MYRLMFPLVDKIILSISYITYQQMSPLIDKFISSILSIKYNMYLIHINYILIDSRQTTMFILFYEWFCIVYKVIKTKKKNSR